VGFILTVHCNGFECLEKHLEECLVENRLAPTSLPTWDEKQKLFAVFFIFLNNKQRRGRMNVLRGCVCNVV
jgi:hypothetical protein